MTSILHRTEIDATSLGHMDVCTTSFRGYLPTMGVQVLSCLSLIRQISFLAGVGKADFITISITTA